MQKFVPRSRVGIFRNERTGNTPFEPKLTFWCVSNYLGAIGTVWLPYETRCKTGRKVQKFMHEVASKFFATNAPDRPHCILNSCFGVFQTIWVHFEQFGLLTKLGPKRAELVEKFVPRSRVGISSNDCSRSSLLDPKFMCLVHLILFGCIWDRLVALRNSVQNGPN